MVHIFKPIPGIPRRSSCVDGLSNHYESSPLDSFVYTSRSVSSSGREIHELSRDIALLLDQKKITSESLNSVVNDILSRVRSSPISDKFAGLSDNELISCIKSRYFQSNSELLAWSEYLENNLSQLLDSAQEPVQEPALEPVQEPAQEPVNA